MFLKIIFTFYLLVTILILILISICLPRLTKSDKNKPYYIFIGYYIINTLFLNYCFGINPLLTIFINLFFLLISNFIGGRIRVMGLTGQICSGKSTVARYLREKHKASVIEIDEVNREVLALPEVKKEIRRKFGDDVFDSQNQLNKLEMRRIIYANQNKRKELERITHGRVFKLLLKKILEEKFLYGNKYVFIENAILLRFVVLRYICFPIVAVCTTKMAEIIGRVMQRDGCDRATAENILANQMKTPEFIENSDYVIFNDGDEDSLYKEVDTFIGKLSQ